MTRVAPALAAGLLCAGCDPIVNVAGAFFPAWAAACAIGVALALALRWVFIATGLEPYLGPRKVVYPCLAVLVVTLVWLVLYRS